jgi:UDP-glucose 4-epimerase
MRVLITGGAGFIGSHLAEYFHRSAHVRVLDDLRTGHRRNLEGLNVEFIEGSITDRHLVEEAMRGVDYVFHLAALVSVPESVEHPHQCVELNVTGLLNVLEAAARARVRKLCFSSSAAVYGNNPKVPKTEEMRPEPRSPYAVTKLDGEYYCEHYAEAGRLETASLRYFNVFGPRQDPAGAYAAAVPIFIKRALHGEPLTIHGDGAQTRDFVYVKDIVAANVFAAMTPGLTGSFNAGYGGQITIRELAERIVALAGSRSEIRYAPERAGDVRHSRASVEKLRAVGFTPTGSLDAGLDATLAYFRSQLSPR